MGALFNLNFDKFIAPTIAKIVYVLAMIGIVLSYISFVAGAFNVNSGFGVFALLILGPLGALLALIFVRVGLESLLATIFTAQNTAELVRLQGGTGQPTYGTAPWTAPPSAPPASGGPAAPPEPPAPPVG